MTLKSRDVAIAATLAFIAWGLVTGWVPTLRYIGYAFTTGFCLALLSIAALILLSSRPIQDYDNLRERAPRTAAFIDPVVWKSDTAWLAKRDNYNPTPLYPSSYIISNALDSLLEWLLRDFIASWYRNITRNPNFVYEVDRAVRAALINIKNRLSPLDLTEIAVLRFVPIVTDHLKDFYEAERAIRGKNLNRNVTESEELDLAIAGKYRNGRLHPAASLAFSDPKIVQQEHLRKIVARILPMILPENLIGSRIVSVLLKEILACAVVAPLMQILSDPDVWNQLIEVYGQTMLQDRKTVRKLRAALDQHTSPNPKATKPRTFPRLSSNDDERKFERFIRAIRHCSNLSDARRFRSEVASQLTRESMMEDQDPTYLRRLETGKHLLDQRVGKLSAVGGVTLPRPLQPDFGNSHTRSRVMDPQITEILRDASGLSYFMEFMDRQKLMTLVEFWIVVEGFRNPLEEDTVTDDSIPTTRPQWNDADRTDLAQIYEAYLLKPELNVSEQSRATVKIFLKAGKTATMSQYLEARSVILMAQSANLELMREKHFPNFKKSDLYYKYLTSDDPSSKTAPKPPVKASKTLSVDSIPESSAKVPPLSRFVARTNARALDLRRNASSNNDLNSSVKVLEPASDQQSRRSLEGDRPAPLFDDDFDNEVLSRSTQSIDSEPFSTVRDYGNREQMVEAMEAALNDIMTDEKRDDEITKPLFEPFESATSPSKQPDSPRSSEDLVRIEASSTEKGRGRPNLASLGLVSTGSRIGVFTDNDLFDDEEKFIEDEYADPEESADEKSLDEEIHQAAPGDLGLAEAISALTMDIERLVAQESVVDTLTRKAELTNNGAELRILGKSRSSLQREIRRKELQRQQYIVQESDNSLFGRANVEIKSVMVGKDSDGQEFALYVIEVQRKAVENMPAASWAVARRYSEFHDLHQRLRNIYPAVRHLDFPRRRLVMKLQREFLHKRRGSLEFYLKELLRLPAVCSSRDLRAFLSQQAIISYPDADPAGERRDIVSRIYNSVTDGMDEFMGNLPALDQLSIAGQNLISAATSQFNPVAPTGSAPEGGNSFQSAEAHAELLAFENREVEPFVKPICDLFLETFELNRDRNWLRGRAVVVVLHQLLGGTVERKVRDAAHALIAEKPVLKYVDLIKDTMWPGGGPLKREFAVRTGAQKKQSRHNASVMLATLVPDLVGHVVGRANAQAASRRLFATVNNQRLNTHLTFTILDGLIGVLFAGEKTTMIR